MPALSDVLSEAASHDAFEVIMEVGQPVLMQTSRGGVPVGGELSEDDLFAALTAVLDQEQQVELMVGNVVEFHVTAKGDWHVVTEPGRDGISIRARIAGAVSSAKPSAGPSIDLPPVAPFSGGGVDLPPVAEDSFSNLSLSNSSPDEVEAIEFSAEFAGPDGGAADSFGGSDGGFEMPSAPDPRDQAGQLDAPDQPGALNQPDALDAPNPLDPLDPLDPLGPLSSAGDVVDQPGADEDDEDLEFDLVTDDEPDPAGDFALVEPPPSPPPVVPAPAPKPNRADMGRTRDLGPGRGDAPGQQRHDSATRLNLVPPPASPIADTRSDLGMVSDRTPPVSGSFEEVAAQVPTSGLTLVHGADADDVAATLACETVLVDGTSTLADAAATLHELPRGSVAVLRVEDPSEWLAWCLRRLEEGYGVLIETRAISPGGAKRSLLGPTATVRAESWLGRHVLRSIIEIEGVWMLVLPS